MRICHLCLNGPYNEGWNYQENILPKYHVKLGHEVFQIVTPYMWEKTKIVESTDKEYENKEGVHVFRLKAKKGLIGGTRFNRYPEVLPLLEKISPDILFIHDLQCLDMITVSKYLKAHKKCIAYVDNHSDFSNSARNWISKYIIHGIIWKKMAQLINPYVKKFYGVLPARVDFLVDMYGLPRDKIELLEMGADDDLVYRAINFNARKTTREKYGIDDDIFLVMTGGKINSYRPETLNLMQAINESKVDKLKLLFFGSVDDSLKERFNTLCNSDRIVNMGWIDSQQTYDIMAAADLMVFPGLHSVMWEQAVGMGIPCVFKEIEGFHHVDVGGNAEFLKDVSVVSLRKTIEELACDENKYNQMKVVATKNGMKHFSYKEIAEKSIQY